MEGYLVGSTVRLAAAFTTLGFPADAGTLTLTIQAGSAAELVDLTGSIVHDGLGAYHVDFDIDTPTEPNDPHRLTWRSTGAMRAVVGDRFYAQALTP